MNYLAVMLLCLAAFANAEPIRGGQPVRLPEFFHLCQRNTGFDGCLKNNLQDLLPRLAKGLPELGLDPLDPFSEPEIQINYKNSQILGNAVFRNVKTYGFSHVKINEVRSELTDAGVKLEVDISIPRIDMEGTYKGEGRFAAIVFSSKGYFNLSMSGVSASWKINGDVEKIDGQNYVRIKHFTMRPEVSDMKVYMSDLFPGNPELSEATVAFMNERWPVFYKELLPYAEEYWDLAMSRVANKIFLTVPYDQLIPKA